MAHAPVDQNTLRRGRLGLRALDRDRAQPGYTLFSPIAGAGEVYLVDLGGETVHRWDLPCAPGRHAKLLENGNLFYQGRLQGGEALYPLWDIVHGGWLAEIDPAGNVVREAEHPYHHHDAAVLRNGNLLVNAVEPLPAAAAAAVMGGIPGSEAPGGVIYGDVVYEMTWTGTILWRWGAWEHLDPATVVLEEHYAREHWPMCNSVSEAADGRIVIGYRSASTVVIVDRPSGEVVWRLGPEQLAQQHYPHELETGNLLVFDNGSFRPGSSVPYSRVVEIDPRTGVVVWEYRDNPPQNFYSPYMSSGQRLQNGNTLIAEGSFGRIFEVTPGGEVVWEYVSPYFGSFDGAAVPESSRGLQNAIFRAYRYPPERLPWLSPGTRTGTNLD